MFDPLLDPRVREAVDAVPDGLEPLGIVRRLRKLLSSEEARAAAGLHALRVRARRKLPHAERLLLTEKGLEQATDQWVAALRAERIARWKADALVLDATAGIGGDALTRASSGPSARPASWRSSSPPIPQSAPAAIPTRSCSWCPAIASRAC